MPTKRWVEAKCPRKIVAFATWVAVVNVSVKMIGGLQSLAAYVSGRCGSAPTVFEASGNVPSWDYVKVLGARGHSGGSADGNLAEEN